MIYGYCRISTKKQNIERQERNIKAAYPDAVLVKEIYTGTKQDRPEWNKLIKRVKSGDTIIFDEVSRMSRNAEEGFETYEKLYNDGVDLIFLKEAHINTAVYKRALNDEIKMTGTNVDFILEGVNRYLLALAKEQIRLAFMQSQKEVDYLHQRTKEGLETARLAGKRIGRQPGVKIVTDKRVKALEIIRQHNKEYGGTLTDAQCIKLCGVSKPTFYKYKAAIKQE